MLDQAPDTANSEEPATVLFEDEEKEWAAVTAVAPALDRLPDMVADLYGYDAEQDPAEQKEIQEAVRDRVRSGLIFVFKVIGDNVNKLFEQFDVHFGAAVDLLMDDIEATYTRDESTVEDYTGEEVCGRLFGYIAMERYCKHRSDNDPNDGSPVDEQTGFYKNMEPMPIHLILESVLNCVRMTPEFKIGARRQASLAIHTHIFLLLDADRKTVWH